MKLQKQLITDSYTFAISEENALFERTVERSVEYYKLIAAPIDPTDYDARDDAMDDVYNTYYDGIVEDGYDVAPYAKWSEEFGACYKEWSDSSSSIYKSWSDTSSKLYGY